MAEITREQIEAWRDFITSGGILGTKPTGSDVLAVMSLALDQEADARLGAKVREAFAIGSYGENAERRYGRIHNVIAEALREESER